MKVDIATADLFTDFDGKRYYFCAQYCKDTFEEDPKKYRDSELIEDKPTQLVAIDPICKMDVDTATAELFSDYEGKRYYFCAPYCKQTFDVDPLTYRDQDFRE